MAEHHTSRNQDVDGRSCFVAEHHTSRNQDVDGRYAGCVFGGVGILRGLVAALGAALFVGNTMALLATRKPSSKDPTWSQRQQRRPDHAPAQVRRTPLIVMSVLGLVIFVWAVASIIAN